MPSSNLLEHEVTEQTIMLQRPFQPERGLEKNTEVIRKGNEFNH